MERVPNESFPQEDVVAIAKLASADEAKGMVMKSKTDWKRLLGKPDVAQIVLVGADDPAEYGVPIEGLTRMSTFFGNKLAPCHFQIVENMGVLIFSKADLAEAVASS